MSRIYTLFLKGLIVVLPVTVTIYVLVLVAAKSEGVFGEILKSIVGEEYYLPGFGIALTFLVILSVGILVSNLITGKIINFGISKFEKAPVIKSIYTPIKDLISLFADGGHSGMNKVVLVDLTEQKGYKALGLITRDEFSDIAPGVVQENEVIVYIPMSLMLGGFSMIVPKDQVKEVNIPVEKAFKLAITGWVKK